jgi:serine/threonine protein kinase
MSPARFQNLDVPLCNQDDFYAVGLIILEVLTGETPFQALEEDDVERRIMDGVVADMSRITEVDVLDTIYRSG